MDKRASHEKEAKRKQVNFYERTIAERERLKDEYERGLSDAHKYVERRTNGNESIDW